MTRSVEDDAKAIMRMMVRKGVKAGGSYKNPVLMQNALILGIDGEDLDKALTFAGEKGWIANGPNDTTTMTPDGHKAGTDPNAQRP